MTDAAAPGDASSSTPTAPAATAPAAATPPSTAPAATSIAAGEPTPAALDSLLEPRHRRLYFARIGVAVLLLWVVPLRSSLWLDELETGWIVREGPSEAVRRIATTGRPCSIAYMVGLATLVEHAGASELVLRLPSLIAMLVATRLVVRLGARLRDRETGLIAAALFAVTPGIVFAAGDARWYALALAADVAAMLALVHAVEAPPGRSRGATIGAWLVYTLATTALVYLHSLWALVVVVHGLYVLQRGGVQALTRLAASLVTTVALTVPILSQARGAERVFWAPIPAISDLASALVPSAVVAPVVFALAVAAACGAPLVTPPPGDRSRAATLLVWHAWPPLVLFVVARTTPLRIFVDRYFLCGAPGLALLLALGIRAVGSARGRLTITAAVVATGLAAFEPTHFVQDYRDAIVTINARATPETLVLVPAMFFEGLDARWFESDPDKAAMVVAPVHSIYPLGGRVIPLPLAMSEDAVRRVEAAIAPEVAASRELFLLRRGNAARMGAWLEGRLAAVGWRCETTAHGDDVFVMDFTPGERR